MKTLTLISLVLMIDGKRERERDKGDGGRERRLKSFNCVLLRRKRVLLFFFLFHVYSSSSLLFPFFFQFKKRNSLHFKGFVVYGGAGVHKTYILGGWAPQPVNKCIRPLGQLRGRERLLGLVECERKRKRQKG